MLPCEDNGEIKHTLEKISLSDTEQEMSIYFHFSSCLSVFVGLDGFIWLFAWCHFPSSKDPL